MLKFAILLANIILFISCGSDGKDNNGKSASDTTAKISASFDSSIPKGTVVDSVPCKNANESYAVYLPTHYNSDKSYPCVFFFDAHARGAMPLRRYKELAEQYDILLIGSNNSKNGMALAESDEVAEQMMSDAASRFNIDAKRRYVAGFSGGARVASAVAMQDGNIAGVIACAAGLPGGDKPLQNHFDYFGLVGVYDFNYNELEHVDEIMEQNGFKHQLLTFTGKHAWPPANAFETALLWMQVNAVKEKLQAKDDAVIAAAKKRYDEEIKAAQKAKDPIKEQQLLSGIVRLLDGLADVSVYQKQLAALSGSNIYNNAVSLEAELQQQEKTLQQQLAQEFSQHDNQWWGQKLSELKHNIKAAKTPYEAQMYQRVINYLGLVCYMNINHALNGNDLANADSYLKVFKMADPENADCSYLRAIYYMKQDNKQGAIASLSEATKLGYDDIIQISNDPAFAALYTDARFNDIVKEIVANRKK